ncbi:hypothetical protein B484DRAFT_395568, partial [Ochromonadaceae sp. CCMP2298]
MQDLQEALPTQPAKKKVGFALNKGNINRGGFSKSDRSLSNRKSVKQIRGSGKASTACSTELDEMEEEEEEEVGGPAVSAKPQTASDGTSRFRSAGRALKAGARGALGMLAGAASGAMALARHSPVRMRRGAQVSSAASDVAGSGASGSPMSLDVGGEASKRARSLSPPSPRDSEKDTDPSSSKHSSWRSEESSSSNNNNSSSSSRLPITAYLSELDEPSEGGSEIGESQASGARTQGQKDQYNQNRKLQRTQLTVTQLRTTVKELQTQVKAQSLHAVQGKLVADSDITIAIPSMEDVINYLRQEGGLTVEDSELPEVDTLLLLYVQGKVHGKLHADARRK